MLSLLEASADRVFVESDLRLLLNNVLVLEILLNSASSMMDMGRGLFDDDVPWLVVDEAVAPSSEVESSLCTVWPFAKDVWRVGDDTAAMGEEGCWGSRVNRRGPNSIPNFQAAALRLDSGP